MTTENNANNTQAQGKFPRWLKAVMPDGETYHNTAGILKNHGLVTVCQEARCPNIGECWRRQTATFMILGECCTRHCRFCAITQNQKPLPPDPTEPERIANAVRDMKLTYVVMTSVTRDDLPDGGAKHFVDCTNAIKSATQQAKVEVLTPDFMGNKQAIQIVAASPIFVFNHNIEMVSRLYKQLRPEADYRRSLEVLRYAKTINPEIITKSGFMLGLGEEISEVELLMADLREAGVTHLTIGQYLCAKEGRAPVARYVHPDEFAMLRQKALDIGFIYVDSAPLARSSYHAERQLQ